MTLTPDVLATTHAASFSDQRPWSAAEFATLLQSPGLILCGDARSFILGRVVADEAEVLTVATRPEDRRQGLAATCLAQFVIAAKAAGATWAFLEVADDNEAAKRLYLNQEFIVTGRRPRYYTRPDSRRVDALVMQKRL